MACYKPNTEHRIFSPPRPSSGLPGGTVLVLVLLLLGAVAAEAQTTYVSNIGQTASASDRTVGSNGGFQFTQAQPFNTGDNADGYTLSAIVAKVASGTVDSNDVPRVSIYSSSSGNPGSSLYTLTNPVPFASGDMTFTAPANATLAKETDYFVVFEETADRWEIKSTQSNGVDTAESGWGIGITHAWRNSDTGDWSSHSNSLLITIKGTPGTSTDATLSALALSGVTLAPTFAPATQDYTATVVNSVMQTTVPATAADTPSLSSISFSTSPASGDTYTRGEVIRISVIFDGTVELSNPNLLRLALTVGSVTEQVPPVATSSRSLLFSYTVKQSDLDADGISVPANPLSLNGGAITVPGDPDTAVTLTHSGIADDATHKVDGSRVVVPTVRTILFTAAPVLGDTFRRGETIVVAATFDKAVKVTGEPQFALTIGTSVRNASRRFSSTAPSPSVAFYYTVEEGDVDADGISVAANALSLNGGAIELADGTIAADITHPAVAADPARKVDGTLGLPPTVASVYVEFQPEDELAYQLGEEIRARAAFDSAIEVTGRPQLALTIGTTTRRATYSRISGATRMEFLYTVQASDMDADGISISADALTLNGGSITGADRTPDAVLTHDAADADPEHKVDGGASFAPQVASVGFSFTPRSGQAYVRGETIYMSVQFDRMAEVTGSPRVALIIGGNTRYATYHSVSTPRPFRLRFVYTVQASDMDADGISIPANPVDLNGGAITLPGVPEKAAVLTHSNVDNDPARKVDGSLTAAPAVDAVAFFGSPLIGTTYTAGEDIGVYARFDREVDATGEPQLALAIGANTRQASFGRVWESNLRYILFSYIVQASDLDADGINVPADALSLNGGTITLRDDATTNAVLTNSATAADPTRKVQGATTSAPEVLSIHFSNAPSGGNTYALREEITANVQFTKALDVSGTPRLALTIGANTRQAVYQSILGSCKCTLRFSYSVQSSDTDTDGIEIATNSLTLNSGTIKLAGASSVNAGLSHSAVNADATRKVDGSIGTATDATLSALALSGVTLAPTFSWATQDYTATVGNAVMQTTVTATPTHSGATVAFKDGDDNALTNPVTLAVGDNVIKAVVTAEDTTTMKTYMVTVTRATNTAPTFSASTFQRSVAENSPAGTDVGNAVTATDADKDPLSYTLEGTDAASFAIVKTSGQIRTKAGGDYNHEAEPNTYSVEVSVTDDTATARTTVMITVTDVDEQPGTPDAPMVAATAGTTDSLAVRWAAPDTNGGPDLTGYEVQYRKGTSGPWIPWTHSGTGTSATITRLDAGNEYQVQVRALNGETPSEWSVAEPGQTNAPTTVISIEITSNPGSDRTYAAGDEIQVTVTFSETVEVTGTPQLTLNVGGTDRTAGYDSGTGTDALVFAYEVAIGDEDTVGVSIESGRIALNGGTIEDKAENNAVLDHEAVAPQVVHTVDGVRPELAATGGAVVDGTTLKLTYDEPLDGSSTPASGDFTVSGGDQTRTVTGVRVNGSAVELTLDAGAEHLEAGIRVSYTPGDNPIQDVPGNDAEALSQEPVTNDTPDTTPPEVSSLAITSNPGSDRTYAAGDEIQVTVTFSETVEVTGTPQLTIELGGGDRTADYQGGTGTAALVFVYEVADGDEDTDGVSVEAGRITLNGGTIEDEADNDAVLDHAGLAADSGHKVDGVRPAFVSAAVDGSALTLTYGEALDGGSRPAPGDFTVEVDGSGRSVSGVSVNDTVVTLTLNPAVEHGDTGIRVSYSPGTNPLRDAVGNDALGLSNRSVTNTTDAPNTAPEITSPGPFEVTENQAWVTRLTATDADPGDEVTGWAIVGGADQGQFEITSDTGDLSFRTAPDYEAPGDNEYEVTVEVRSGAGARELEAEQTFTVRVTDEREPPGIPEAPTFSGETAESLTVSWAEPDNTGPAITDYDVQYREKGMGRFIDGQHVGPGFSLTLDDLDPGTVYEVQVRATNDEGTSDWSESGEGMTITPLTVQMTTGLPPPVEGAFTVRFSFSETVTGFSSNDIASDQNPACSDDQNNPVFCDPGIGRLDTLDDRVFTTMVTPETDRVAHNYTLTLTVSGGAVRSSVGNKPNEEGTLEVRVAPPGVTVPISSIGLRANSGNGEVTLRWSTPANTGGAAIVRYEYRWGESGGEFGDWMSVAPSARSATVSNLTNGTEYVFEVRGANALGYGSAETAMATPEEGGVIIFPPPPPPTGNNSPIADAGPDQLGVWEGALVTLDGSGSSDPDGDPLRYRWNQYSGERVALSSRDVANPTFTAPEGLTAEAVLSFRLLVTDPSGRFDSDTVTVTVDPEAEPPLAIYYFPHLAVGAGWQTTITYINYSSEEVSCQTEFLSDQGTPLMVSFADRGTVPSRTDVLLPGESVHEETNVALSAPAALGWARAACTGPLKASLLFRGYDSEGMPTGEAGVNATTVPATRFVTFAEQGEGRFGTGVAYANPSDTEAVITFTARGADGQMLASENQQLSAGGHGAQNMAPLFGLPSFTGSLEVTSTEPIVSLSLNNEADPVFSSLPPGDVDAAAQGPQGMTTYYFPHLAVGAGWQTTITYINYSPQQVTCQTNFLSDDGAPLLVSFAGLGTVVSRSDDLPPGGSVHQETNVELSAPLAPGWARATCSGPLKASLLYRRFEGGVPTAEAAVNAATVAATRFVTFAEQGEGKFGTGVAYANPSPTAALVTFTARDAAGEVLASVDETLLPNGHDAQNMAPLFGLSSFTGSLEVTSTAPIVSLSLNNEADPVFSSLPPGELDAAAQ